MLEFGLIVYMGTLINLDALAFATTRHREDNSHYCQVMFQGGSGMEFDGSCVGFYELYNKRVDEHNAKVKARNAKIDELLK